MIGTRVRDEQIESLVLRRNGCRFLKRRDGRIRLSIRDINLRQQILHVRAVVAFSTQIVQDGQRGCEFVSSQITEGEIETSRVFVRDSSPRSDQMRNSLAKQAFASKGSSLP